MMDLRRVNPKDPLHSAYFNYGSNENPQWQEIRDIKNKQIDIIRKPDSHSLSDLHSFMHSNPFYLDSLSQSKINVNDLEAEKKSLQDIF